MIMEFELTCRERVEFFERPRYYCILTHDDDERTHALCHS